MKKLLLVMALLLLVGNVLATSQFYDTDPADHLWTTEGNWDEGIPDIDDWAKIRCGSELPGATIVTGIDAIADRVHIGYSEGGAMTVDGGTLTTKWDDDLLLGKQGGAGVVDMISGTINVGRDLEVGAGAPGIFTMTGGTVIVGDDLMIPESSGSAAEVYLDGGTITLDNTYKDDPGNDDSGSRLSMSATGLMDITFGTLIIKEDVSATVQGYVDNGWITGFGIVGNVTVDVAGSTTTVTADADPLLRTPANGADVPVGDVDLSWINLDPNDPEVNVWVDVWFGADVDAMTKVVDGNSLTTDPGDPSYGIDATSVTVSAPVAQDYFWRVDTYRYGDPAVVEYGNEPNFVIDAGATLYFTATDDNAPSVVIDTLPTATWVGEPISLQATVTDDGISDVSVVWTSDADPNAVFSNETYDQETKIATADVTTDALVWGFTVTATVSDASNPDADFYTVEHYGASTACAAARNPLGLADANPADLNGDCDHDLSDFATIASDWVRPDYKPLDEPRPFNE